MVSTVVKNTCNDAEFPKLMINTLENTIVLFQNPSRGVIVWSTVEGFTIGKSDISWNENRFIDFHGSVTLRN